MPERRGCRRHLFLSFFCGSQETVTEEKLIRTVGFKTIVALTINGIIGAGIFALPANTARVLGVASPVAFLIAGLFTLILVLCFAELGGLYDRTGGAYLYASEAFGGMIAFLIGWMYFLARLTSTAALSNALVGFIGFFFPLVTPWREIVIAVALLIFAAINYLGIQLSTRVITGLTIIKLLALASFIFIGIFFVKWEIFRSIEFPSSSNLTTAILPAMYAFTGFEIIAVPSAEYVNPKRNLPLGILGGSSIAIAIYILIQTVAVGVDPNIATSEAPLAQAASLFIGPSGSALISAGAIFSTIGTIIAILLIAPRILYAMALEQQLPSKLATIHPRFRTPSFAIISFTLITLPVAISTSFIKLATLSAMSRLITYIGSAIALLILRPKKSSQDSFRIPGGPTIPVLAILLCLFFLTAATRKDWVAGGIAIIVGLILYGVAARKQIHHEAIENTKQY
ncbi:MAG: amino acid transporter [Acidobacteria bacterium]|nr:MAG: amino acid transporter [Acidobacteriota bacterium]